MEARCHEDKEDIVDTVTELLEVARTFTSTYVFSCTFTYFYGSAVIEALSGAQLVESSLL
jgi:hypothetical protein